MAVKKLSALGLSLAFAFTGVSGAVLSTAAPAAAAEIPYKGNMVSNVKVDDSRLNAPPRLGTTETVNVSFDLAIPENVKPGDTLTLKLSKGYSVRFTGSIDLKTKDGVKVGDVTHADTMNTVVVKFSEIPEELVATGAKASFPVGLSASTEGEVERKLFFTTSTGKTIDTGKSYIPSEIADTRNNTALTYAHVDADTKNVRINPVAVVGKTIDSSTATITIEPKGDNWRFDPKRFPDLQSFISNISMDDDTTVNNPKGQRDNMMWEFDYTGKYKVVSVTPKKMVVKLEDIPKGYNLRVSVGKAFATKVGKDETYTATYNIEPAGANGNTSFEGSVKAGSVSGIADAKPVVIEDVEPEEPAKPTNPKLTVPPKITESDFNKGGNTVTVTKCEPGTDVSFTARKKGDKDSPAITGKVKADKNGTAKFTVKDKDGKDVVGDYTVTAKCGDKTMTGDFTVTPDPKKPEEPAKPANPSLDVPPTITDDNFVETGNPLTVTECKPGADVKFRVTKRGDDTVKPYETTVKADKDGKAVFTVKGQNPEAKAEYVGSYDVEATCGDKVMKGEFEVTTEKQPEEPAKPVIDPKLDVPPTITDSDFVETGNPITVTKCEPGADVKFRVTKRGDNTVRPYETTVKADKEGTASFNARGQNRHAKAEYVGMYDVEATCGDKVLKGEFEVTGKPAEESKPREEAPVAEPKNPVVKTGASERSLWSRLVDALR